MQRFLMGLNTRFLYQRSRLQSAIVEAMNVPFSSHPFLSDDRRQPTIVKARNVPSLLSPLLSPLLFSDQVKSTPL
jgi:hypothetical protein